MVQPTSVVWWDGELLLGTAGSGLWALRGEDWQQLGLAEWTIDRLVETADGEVSMFACERRGDCGVVTFDSIGLSTMRGIKEEPLVSFIGLIGLPKGMEGLNPGDLTFASSRTERCAWAVGEQEKVWVTKDCGATWIAHSFEWTVQALAFDPSNADALLVGTRESGAFRMQVP